MAPGGLADPLCDQARAPSEICRTSSTRTTAAPAEDDLLERSWPGWNLRGGRVPALRVGGSTSCPGVRRCSSVETCEGARTARAP
jgi:hypothetical protein